MIIATTRSIQKDMAVSDLTAVILAGGLGSRLRSVIGNSQKVMAKVGEKPFVERIFKQLERVGIRKVVLCVGFMSEQVQEYFGDKFGEIEIKYSIEQLLLGTGGALRFALSQIESDPFLVLNGDSFYDADLGEFFKAHQARAAAASLVLAEVPDTRRYGRVDSNESDEITDFEEKGAVTGPGWINAGIYLLSRSVFEDVPKGHNISLERTIFPALIGNGFYGHHSSVKGFIDIGIPESYEQAKSGK